MTMPSTISARFSASLNFQTLMNAGLYLFAVSLPISHVPAQFGIAISVLAWLAQGLVNRQWFISWHPFLAFVALYIGWNILAAAFSARPLHSLAAVADNEWPLLVMLMLLWTVPSPKALKRIVRIFLISSFFAMVYAVVQAFVGIEFYRGMELDPMGGYYRAIGFYSFYLSFGALAMMVFFIAIAFLFEVKKWRFMSGVVAVVSFFAILASFARSIWLSLGIGIPLLGFLRSKKIGLATTIGLLFVFSLGILTQPALRYRAESIIDLSQNQTRINLWKTAVRISSNNLILGVGEDNWDLFVDRYKVEGYYDTTTHPHNDYLNVLVASGLPGLSSFIGMWIIAITVGIRTWRKSNDPEIKAIALGALLSVAGFLVAAFFQDYYGTFVNCLGWWFIVGLIFSSHRWGEYSGSHSSLA
jgi:O-antigen ligase